MIIKEIQHHEFNHVLLFNLAFLILNVGSYNPQYFTKDFLKNIILFYRVRHR